MLVFIDDSGDPGFKIEKGSSKVFIITLIVFDDNLEAEKTSVAIKELRRKLKVSDHYEFKFNKCSPKFKKNFIETIRSFKFRSRSIMVDKKVVYSQRLKNYKEDFYNFIIMQVLKHSEGYIKEYNVDGEIIYGIAPLGEEYAKKNLKIDNNKLKSIEDL
ncbi:MAG: DUF3800 domain-containing protein, partial [Cyanobacteria bacterium]|nr:DUF3800 domain-containing protein [Cyanobacteriota bacterium]